MDCLPENLTEAMLESETSQHTRSEENVVAGNVEQPKAIQKAEQSKKIRFMLSGLAEDERKDFFDFLSKHNVDFGDENMCDPKVNCHTITFSFYCLVFETVVLIMSFLSYLKGHSCNCFKAQP